MFLELTSPSPTLDALPKPPIHLLRGASLFLDFDGTLVEIADRPDAVRVDARLRELMTALERELEGRIGVISGRPSRQVAQLIGLPRLTVAGSHGLEFDYADGRAGIAPRPLALDEAAAAMRSLADKTPGVSVEDKPLGAALHYRAAPGAERACHALAERLAGEEGVTLQTGKMMVEVRAGGGDKGSAIRALMAQLPMRGTRPVFLGDDDTDEPGFVVAAALGGAGVRVGEGAEGAARYRLPNVAATLDWLEAACEALA